ncbi:unnamed protein product [Microthlaspi erraticum]|uniref:Leucine-rich repeat-containing N-terminal plant-type domain-containing protein n=1 Tax=Microthlaspi erraticum TaxID=1685480 RepID=A0A6D2IWF2_9BRAS|nr:unnamed protein product [Microthlaspi erraticum]
MKEKVFLGQNLIWVLMLLLGQLHGYKICIEKERKALLELKNYMVSRSFDQDQVLPTWTNDTKSNCCQWKGVECKSTSGRVTGIAFGRLYSGESSLLNLSLLHPFEEVRSLNMSGQKYVNLFNGFFDDVEGYKSLSRLKNLEILDLSSNEFNNSIFPFLNAATSLTTLSLRGNHMDGPFQAKELKDLTNLELLDLSRNTFNGTVHEFTHLKKLKALDLSYNEFSGSMQLQELKNWTNLEVLGLGWNRLSGPIEVVCEMKNLQELDLSGNQFVGQLPLCLGSLKKLQITTSQAYSLSVHSPTSQSSSLEKIPSFLMYQKSLRLVDLSSNILSGHIPTWLLANNTELEVLQLQNNSFTIFKMPTIVHNLRVLDFSSNDIGGVFLDNIGHTLPNLVHMNGSNNELHGTFPSSMGEMKNIYFLDLSYNNFSGMLPRSFFRGCFSLNILKLSRNKFSGDFLPKGTNFPALNVLRVDDNLFTGEIGVGLLSSNNTLSILDMSNNFLTGAVPGWISELYALEFLLISNNFLQGLIPPSLLAMPYLSFLDLSGNLFSGALPSHVNNAMAKKILFLHNNNFTGLIPNTLLEHVQILDIRNNELYGGIPQFVHAEDINILLLRGNNLTGSIPRQLCELRNIRLLDLSDNKLNGSIPSCLHNLTFGMAGGEEKIGNYIAIASPPENLHLQFYKFTFVVEELLVDYFTYQEIEIKFTTKKRYDSYTGGSDFSSGILDYMYGMDLSNNALSSVIPAELGELFKLRALNLSHNLLSSSIPSSFSNLKDIESLDLSYNMLHGSIPHQLTSLTSLVVFDVSHNNLSGIISQGMQFNTFNERNYLGNPLLCGPPTDRSCEANGGEEDGEEEEAIDMMAFYFSTTSVYVTVLLGILVLMWFDCPWRRAWLRMVDAFIASARSMLP